MGVYFADSVGFIDFKDPYCIIDIDEKGVMRKAGGRKSKRIKLFVDQQQQSSIKEDDSKKNELAKETIVPHTTSWKSKTQIDSSRMGTASSASTSEILNGS